MTIDDARRRPAQGKVDCTFMHAAHDAFHRDLRCLAAAVEADRSADPAVRTGWATFKNQLHVHHTAEDTSLWPPPRQKVTRPEDAAVLDAMEAEHARIDPAAGPRSRKRSGKARGLRGGAEFFPWMLNGAPADTSKRALAQLPAPARLLYRAVWRPGYARTPRWDIATI